MTAFGSANRLLRYRGKAFKWVNASTDKGNECVFGRYLYYKKSPGEPKSFILPFGNASPTSFRVHPLSLHPTPHTLTYDSGTEAGR